MATSNSTRSLPRSAPSSTFRHPPFPSRSLALAPSRALSRSPPSLSCSLFVHSLPLSVVYTQVSSFPLALDFSRSLSLPLTEGALWQEVSFRQAIPYFTAVVLIYDSNVAIFGDTARTVSLPFSLSCSLCLCLPISFSLSLALSPHLNFDPLLHGRGADLRFECRHLRRHRPHALPLFLSLPPSISLQVAP